MILYFKELRKVPNEYTSICENKSEKFKNKEFLALIQCLNLDYSYGIIIK